MQLETAQMVVGRWVFSYLFFCVHDVMMQCVRVSFLLFFMGRIDHCSLGALTTTNDSCFDARYRCARFGVSSFLVTTGV